MAYALGIDLGTSYSAAAVGHDDGRVEIFQLGQRAAAIPSLVVVRADGEVLVGEAAERRALTEPARTAREFKRRLGDPVPLIIGGTPYGPEALLAILLRSIVGQVTEQLGSAPAHIVITHPASYGPYKLDLLRQAARAADLGAVSLLSEPVAAAVHYASLEQVPKGTTIAVYDFGGGTFDATMLDKIEDGFEVTGTPEGLERLGGVDFDEAIFRHVVGAVGAPLAALDPDDAAVQAGFARLREECRRAKEALSADSDATIPVAMPGIQTEVRITRAEFEAMIEPRIAETVAAVDRAARSADIRMVELDRILLVGGTSRIPRIAEKVRAVTGRPVAVDVHPKHGVALGAARIGQGELRASLPKPGPSPVAVRPGAATAPPAVPGATPVQAAGRAVAVDRAEGAAGSRAGSSSGSRPPGTSSPPAARSQAPQPARPARPAWLLPVAIGGGVALVAIVALLASGILAGRPSGTATPTGAGIPTLPPAASPLPTTGAPTEAGGTRARITAITLVGDRYEAAFETTGFIPSMAGQHVHFHWDTIEPDQAGEPGEGPYVVYAGESPFAQFGPAGQPGSATAICIIVANVDHSVVPGSGSCTPLP